MSIVDGLVKIGDYGYVKFIDSMGSDESIIEAARMSTGRGFEGWEKDGGLLDFLWRHKHATPFEMCELALEIQAPIFVFREWHRHRTQSYNEFSARYSKMPDMHYLPELHRLKKQSVANKQGSGEEVDRDYADMVVEKLRKEQQQVYSNYEQMLSENVAKEIARINTPVSRYSRMRAKTDLRNWLSFCNLRMRPNAQEEIREFAIVVGNFIKSKWPRTWELFEEYDLKGVSFSKTEMQAIRRLLATGADVTMVAESEGLSGSKLKEFISKINDGGIVVL